MFVEIAAVQASIVLALKVTFHLPIRISKTHCSKGKGDRDFVCKQDIRESSAAFNAHFEHKRPLLPLCCFTSLNPLATNFRSGQVQ